MLNDLTLRNYFAAMALQGLLHSIAKAGVDDDAALLAKLAYKFADAMLNEGQPPATEYPQVNTRE